MFSFFKVASYRKTFYKGFLACIVGALIVVGRALGKGGHPDETTIYLFAGIIVCSIFVMSWVLERNYRNRVIDKKRK